MEEVAYLVALNSASVKDTFINSPKMLTNTGKTAWELIHQWGTTALNPTIVSTDRYNAPSVWGNINGAEDIREKRNESNLRAEDSAYYVNGSFIILSVRQHNYWTALGVDMTLVTKP